MLEKLLFYGWTLVTVLVIAVLPPFRQFYPGIDNNAFRKVYPGVWSKFFRIPLGDVRQDGIALPLFVEQLTWYVLSVATLAGAALAVVYLPELSWLPAVIALAVLAVEIIELFISTAILKRVQKRRALK